MIRVKSSYTSYDDSLTGPPALQLGTWYVLAVPLLAAMATLRGDSLQIAGFNYTGFLWLGALAVGIGLFIVEKAVRPDHRIQMPLVLWAAWLLVVVASFAWMDYAGGSEARVTLQLAMPVVVGVLASLFIRTRAQLTQLVNACYAIVPLLFLLAIAWAATNLDAELRTDVYIEKRAAALTAVIIGGLFLAGAPSHFWRAWLGWGACVGVTVITGSRMATLAMLLLPIFNPVSRQPMRKLATVAVALLVGMVIYLTPAFQERFFAGESAGVADIASGNFDSAGRFDAWPLILERAWDRPWLGHGVGTVERIMADVWGEMKAPHNDYLRVGYELGIVGLAVFLSVMLIQLFRLGREVRQSDGVVQQAFAAAWLGLFIFLPIAVTDNPITYNLCFMDPVFALMGAAYSVSREERRAATGSAWRYASPSIAPNLTHSPSWRANPSG